MKVVKFNDGKFGVRRWTWNFWDRVIGFEYLAINNAKNGYFWWWYDSDDYRRTDSQIIAIAAMNACLKKESEERAEKKRLKDKGKPV